MESEIVITKRICKTTWDEYQFLTSSYPNRNDKERIFESSDGMWRKDFLPELKADEYDKEYNGEPCT